MKKGRKIKKEKTSKKILLSLLLLTYINLIMLIIGRIAKQAFSRLSTLTKYIQPVSLPLQSIPQIPVLRLKSEKYLLENWWSESPFIVEPDCNMAVPVFSFTEGHFLKKFVQLPQDIFNQPLRRDLIHRLYDFRIKLNKFTTKMTRNRAMTHGSGKKMRPQKGQGRARMGDKRAPHLFKGGKAHGAKPRVYSYPLNAKIKLNALKALLSAKLAEGKIKIIDSEVIPEGKTKYVASAFQKHINDERGIACVITSRNCDQNFQRAQRNFPRVLWHDTYSLDVFSLFKADRILITQRGLQELVENIYKTHYVVYRHPSLPKLEESKAKEDSPEQEFDPSQPYEFKFKILAEYMEQYQKLKKEKPELIAREQFKTRRRGPL